MKKVFAVLLLILLCALWGCSKGSEAETDPASAQSGEQTPAAEPSGEDGEKNADEVDPAVAAVTNRVSGTRGSGPPRPKGSLRSTALS